MESKQNLKKKEKNFILQPLIIFIVELVLATLGIVLINVLDLDHLPENWLKTIAYDEIGMIVALCMLFSLMMEGGQSRKNLDFMRLITVTATTMFFDMCCWIFDGAPKYRNIVMLSNTMFYIFGIMSAIFFWLYVKTELELNGKHHKVFGIISAALVVIMIVLIVINWFTGWCFTVDETGTYHRTDWFWLTYIPAIFVFTGFAIVIVRHKMSFYDKTILLTYELAPICAMIIQTVTYGLSIIYPSCLMAELLIYGNIYLKRAKQMAEQEAKLAQQNMAIMVSQIQPHFLYNTLTTIGNLCRKDPDRAEEATIMFSRYLRMNLDSLKKMEPVAFVSELEHVKIYLSLEQMRFGDKLNVAYDIKEQNFKIPALSIQPIVENSVKHGIYEKDEPGTLKVSTDKKDGCYEIIIEDDGVGFDTTAPVKEDGRSHVGMHNVLDRLKEMCDAEVSVISSPGNGCKTIIHVPMKKS